MFLTACGGTVDLTRSDQRAPALSVPQQQLQIAAERLTHAPWTGGTAQQPGLVASFASVLVNGMDTQAADATKDAVPAYVAASRTYLDGLIATYGTVDAARDAVLNDVERANRDAVSFLTAAHTVIQGYHKNPFGSGELFQADLRNAAVLQDEVLDQLHDAARLARKGASSLSDQRRVFSETVAQMAKMDPTLDLSPLNAAILGVDQTIAQFAALQSDFGVAVGDGEAEFAKLMQ